MSWWLWIALVFNFWVWILCVYSSGFGGDEIRVQTHKDRSPSDGIQYHRWATAAGTVNKTKRLKCTFKRLRNLWFLHWRASLRLSSFRFTKPVCFHPCHASDAGSARLRVYAELQMSTWHSFSVSGLTCCTKSALNLLTMCIFCWGHIFNATLELLFAFIISQRGFLPHKTTILVLHIRFTPSLWHLENRLFYSCTLDVWKAYQCHSNCVSSCRTLNRCYDVNIVLFNINGSVPIPGELPT